METVSRSSVYRSIKNALFLVIAGAFIIGCSLRERFFDNTFFEPLPANDSAFTLQVAAGCEYRLLFTELTDTVYDAEGNPAPAREKHDLLIFVPQGPDSGLIYVGHESYKSHPHGDGGGGTVFSVIRKGNRWERTGKFMSVDFAPVGGTLGNCAGTMSPWGTLLTAEEFPAESNEILYLNGEGVHDTSDYNGNARYLNNGFVTEVDLTGKKALRKLYSMGRFSHEDLVCAKDKKTVYLTDDYSPSVFFKFVADSAGDYSQGTLYAYRQARVGAPGKWLALPRKHEDLLYARDRAISLGASLFNRIEWIQELPGGKFILSETGKDVFNWDDAVEQGGTAAPHLKAKEIDENTFSDIFGRLLVFDPASDKMDVWLEGGFNDEVVFSNPDALTLVSVKGVDYLVVQEDGWGSAEKVAGRPDAVSFNEVFLIRADLEKPELGDLKRLMNVPAGSEITGAYPAPQGMGLFFCVQAPKDSISPAPFHLSSAAYLQFPE